MDPVDYPVSADAEVGARWSVYIDGLNFYAAVRGRPHLKWVDFARLAERLIPAGDTVQAVKYFTAQISEKAAEDSAAPRRQRVLIRAIRASGVSVFEGKFRVPEEWRSVSSKGGWQDRLRPEPTSDLLSEYAEYFATHDSRPWKVRVELPQEKFTDVAIATQLLRDYYKGVCLHAILLTNDSDLRPAVEAAVADGHEVGVISPMATVSRDLDRVASWAKPLRQELLIQCQMPDTVSLGDGGAVVNRPAVWK